MRLGYIIDRIDGWFVRVVYGGIPGMNRLSNGLIPSRTRAWLLSLFARRGHLAFTRCSGSANVCRTCGQLLFGPPNGISPDALRRRRGRLARAEALLIRFARTDVLEQLAYNGLNQIWERSINA